MLVFSQAFLEARATRETQNRIREQTPPLKQKCKGGLPGTPYYASQQGFPTGLMPIKMRAK